MQALGPVRRTAARQQRPPQPVLGGDRLLPGELVALIFRKGLAADREGLLEPFDGLAGLPAGEQRVAQGVRRHRDGHLAPAIPWVSAQRFLRDPQGLAAHGERPADVAQLLDVRALRVQDEQQDAGLPGVQGGGVQQPLDQGARLSDLSQRVAQAFLAGERSCLGHVGRCEIGPRHRIAGRFLQDALGDGHGLPGRLQRLLVLALKGLGLAQALVDGAQPAPRWAPGSAPTACSASSRAAAARKERSAAGASPVLRCSVPRSSSSSDRPSRSCGSAGACARRACPGWPAPWRGSRRRHGCHPGSRPRPRPAPGPRAGRRRPARAAGTGPRALRCPAGPGTRARA